MVWDSEGISESEDRVLEEIFESVDADDSSDDDSSGDDKKKGRVKKEGGKDGKSKGKKRKRDTSSGSERIISSSSSSEATLWVHICTRTCTHMLHTYCTIYCARTFSKNQQKHVDYKLLSCGYLSQLGEKDRPHTSAHVTPYLGQTEGTLLLSVLD